MSKFFKSYQHFARSFLKQAKDKTGASQKHRRVTNMLEDVYRVDELFKLNSPMTSSVYFGIFYQEEMTKEEFNAMIQSVENDLEYYKQTKEWAEQKGEYDIGRGQSKELKELLKECPSYGIYFLYNQDKQLIYIGKSVSGLEYRSTQSTINKNAEYIQFHYPKTKSDTNIYELYFISKYKPLSNKGEKEIDDTTLELPELKHSEITKIYQDVEVE